MTVIDRRPVEANDVTVIDDAALDAAVAKLPSMPGLVRDEWH